MSSRSSIVMVAGLLLLSNLFIFCQTKETTFQQHERPHSNRTARNGGTSVFAPLTRRPPIELPEFRPDFNEDDELLMDVSKSMLYKSASLHGKHNISDAALMSLVATAQIKVFGDMYSHRYSSYNDMRLAAGPGVDQDRCISQLENLVTRADLQAEDKYSSTDVNFYQLMDTWGHFPSGFLRGNSFTAGLYDECNRLKIELPDGDRAPTRYCSMSIRHSNWPRIDRHDVLNIKAGICIPRACDSSVHKHKVELLMRLVEHQFRQLERGQMKFHSLYCLPDEDSPLRSMLNSPKTLATLAFLTGWLSLLMFSTYMHHSLEASSSDSDVVDSNGLTKGKKVGINSHPSACLGFYKMLSIINNTKLLFKTSKSKKSDAIQEASKLETNKPVKIIDFGCVDGIKAIAMIYIIVGHVLMCISAILTNVHELAGTSSISFTVAIFMPAFAVNAFFTITGTLTCYMLFKQDQFHKLIISPASWIVIIVKRYLRIMPIYALVVLYCKTLSKYTASGPLWDYATSSLSHRQACEQEPWAVTLLFTSNFEPPLTLCIPSSWYLSNDFQFLLVTPFFLTLLYKKPRLGQALLYSSIAAGYLAGFWSIYGATVADTWPIAVFSPQGFKTYVSHFSHNYTQPQYRIPAYLIGLLIGYKLHLFEKAKLEFFSSTKNEQQQQQQQQQQQPLQLHYKQPVQAFSSDIKLEVAAPEAQMEEPDLPSALKRYSLIVCLFISTFLLITPYIGSQIPFDKPSAHFMVALITASYHLVMALLIAFYLIPAATGHGNAYVNSFFAASFWKPLARLSLCALLINVEVINYIILGSSNLHHYSNSYHAAMNLLCIPAIYLGSAVVFVLFEAPSRALLSWLLTCTITQVPLLIKKRSDNNKQSQREPVNAS